MKKLCTPRAGGRGIRIIGKWWSWTHVNQDFRVVNAPGYRSWTWIQLEHVEQISTFTGKLISVCFYEQSKSTVPQFINYKIGISSKNDDSRPYLATIWSETLIYVLWFSWSAQFLLVATFVCIKCTKELFRMWVYVTRLPPDQYFAMFRGLSAFQVPFQNMIFEKWTSTYLIIFLKQEHETDFHGSLYTCIYINGFTLHK